MVKIPDDERISGADPGRVNPVRGPKSEAPGRQQRGSAPRGDEVTLSPRAQEYERARELLREAPDVREDVVKRLKAAIESGTHRVDPEAIAERMLAEGFFQDLFRDH